MSNLILSQTTATPQLTNVQLENIYKGLKQNEYLKVRVKQAEKTLDEAEKVMDNQKATIAKQNELVAAKDRYLDNYKRQSELQLQSKDVEIDRLNSVIVETKKDNRRQLWKGIRIGGITVGVLGGAAALYLISR